MWDWTQFVRVSVRIRPEDGFTSTFDQARARTMVSRCYYAAFRLAERVIADKKYPIDNVKDHGVTWLALQRHGTPAEAKAGAVGAALMRDRKKVDYHDVIDGSLEEMSKAAVKRAKEICRALGYPVAALEAQPTSGPAESSPAQPTKPVPQK